ncbi:HlyU family transcriptional regulator [Cognatishimia activa]|uniref:Transcriptional activator HlyU n=1 Tax=Cognatishimia activa TaxID=1715691 RepID=A0A0P1IN87_9RHOB|nr:HlyU family transcriptional regulator [Cognatishimia activa]CUJ14749.1 hypothetical protein TA5113_02444 [Cognatishimia activa]CUK25005.1 hypothetical protein TA5114_00795 [Cognatishimia activa]
MSLLSKLFGKSAPEAPEPVSHQGFLIFPMSQKDGSHFRLGARIEKEIDGELKTHDMIRADTFNTVDAANDEAVRKAKVFIDQMGERIF